MTAPRMLSAPHDFAPHPLYGPCDGFHYGQCAVCRDLLYTLMQERDATPPAPRSPDAP